MFWSKNKKKIVYPCKPQFYYIKVGFKGSSLHGLVLVMEGGTLILIVPVSGYRLPFTLKVGFLILCS